MPLKSSVPSSLLRLPAAARVDGQHRRHRFRRMVVPSFASTAANSAPLNSPLRARSHSPSATSCHPKLQGLNELATGNGLSNRRSRDCRPRTASCESLHEQFSGQRLCSPLSRSNDLGWGFSARSWSSGLDGGQVGGCWRGSLDGLNGRDSRGQEGDDNRRKYSSTLGLLFGVGLITQAAKSSSSSRDETAGQEGPKEGEKTGKGRPGSGGKSPLSCRGIRLEELNRQLREGSEAVSIGLGGDAETATLSMWKVGERAGVTGREQREDGEHIIVQTERVARKVEGEEAAAGTQGRKATRKFEVAAQEAEQQEVIPSNPETAAPETMAIDHGGAVQDAEEGDEATAAAACVEDPDESKDAAATPAKKKRNGKGENGKEANGKGGGERVGFRDRKIIDYENRIRVYSTPDKVFRYFATLKSSQADGEVFMTPEDFLRSLTPGVKQPDGLGLDQFRKFDPSVVRTGGSGSGVLPAHSQPAEGETVAEGDGGGEQVVVKRKRTLLCDEESIFYHLGSRGLISFSDYIFLLTILSTSRRQFEIAFRMFDLNGDGDVDFSEFAKVQEIIRQTTSSGKKHRDHGNTGSTIRKMNSALANYFFGETLSGKLTIERFLDFQHRLQSEILRLEFRRKGPDPESGRITERQFAELLLTYADYSPKKRSAVLKRVKKKYKNTDEQSFPGISLEDYVKIFDLLMHLEDVEKALYFHTLAAASIDQRTLKHVARVTAGVHLGEHVIDVLFTIFDEDGDGGLSNREFVSVMKNKLKRGLEKPKDTGLINLLAAVCKCAISTPGLGGSGAGSSGTAGSGGPPPRV